MSKFLVTVGSILSSVVEADIVSVELVTNRGELAVVPDTIAKTVKMRSDVDFSKYWDAKVGKPDTRSHNKFVFGQTKNALKDGGYLVPQDLKFPKGKTQLVDLRHITGMSWKKPPQSYMYDLQQTFESVYKQPMYKFPNTQSKAFSDTAALFEVHEGDMFEYTLNNLTRENIAHPNHQSKYAVLNMANAYTAGGGVVNGASAQEEAWFRCSDYSMKYNQENKDKGERDLHNAIKKIGFKPKDVSQYEYDKTSPAWELTFSQQIAQFRKPLNMENKFQNFRFLRSEEIRSYSAIAVAASDYKGFIVYGNKPDGGKEHPVEGIVVMPEREAREGAFWWIPAKDLKDGVEIATLNKDGIADKHGKKVVDIDAILGKPFLENIHEWDGDTRKWNMMFRERTKNWDGRVGETGEFLKTFRNSKKCLLKDLLDKAPVVPGSEKEFCQKIFGRRRLAEVREWDLYKKMYSLLYITTVDQQKSKLILSALGSGAFRQPVKHVASLWKKAMMDFMDVYKGKTALVKAIFVIMKDHNDVEGNFLNHRDIILAKNHTRDSGYKGVFPFRGVDRFKKSLP